MNSNSVNVLSYWEIIESLNPIEIPRSRSAAFKTISNERDFLTLNQPDHRYILFLNVTGKGRVGQNATGILIVQENKLIQDTLSASPLHWATRNHSEVAQAPAVSFATIRAELAAVCSDFVCKQKEKKEGGPISFKELTGLSDELCLISGIDSKHRHTKILAYEIPCLRDSANEQAEYARADFFSEDLSEARNLVKEGRAGRALTAYLSGTSQGRIDVLEDSRYSEMAVSPEMMHAGRWPDSIERSLLIGQQGACNTAFHYLKGEGGLFTINGPPGTGKTYSMKQIIAMVVTERADKLCRFDEPNDAFWNGSPVTVRDRTYNSYKIHPDLKKNGIVVTSANNNAVENVSKEIPHIDSIDTALTTELDYYSDIATDVLNTPSWGLIASVLGRASNVSSFVNRFWFKPKEGKTGGLFREWLLNLDEKKGRASFQKAKNDYLQAKEDFAYIKEKLIRARTCLYDIKLNRLELLDIEAVLQNLGQEEGTKGLRIVCWIRSLFDPDRKYKRKLNERAANIKLQIFHLHNAFNRIDEQFSLPLPDDAYWDSDIGDLQNTKGWLQNNVEKARARVFVKALMLHKAFVMANKEKFRANLSLWADVMTARNEEPEDSNTITELWDTFFMVVPVVSTTLASARRLFKGVKPKSIGWCLIEEAGQAIPQSVVGMLMRSKRAVAIGDPMQIRPVCKISSKLSYALRNDMGIDEKYDVSHQSIQTLADASNPFGTIMGVDESNSAQWIGYPLRLHYRCDSPMFTISNEIAYESQMKNGKPRTFSKLPLSFWVENKETGEGAHWHSSYGQDIVAIVDMVEKACGDEEIGMYFLSPFKETVSYIKQSLMPVLLRRMGKNQALAWLTERVGTIHTFQGKETDCVVLVLSVDGQRMRAADWAASAPNLLNVAVTRAKLRLYVIGDKQLWDEKNYYNVMVKELSRAA